jgi:DNA-directed RNA polymerase subunit RPC12/RpoP
MTRCEVCNRSFTTQNALQMHLRDSPVHSGSHKCGICGKSFKSSEALRMHSRDTPGHTQSYSCAPCNRTFISNEALRMHIRDSPAHNLLPDTPLNRFFQSFPTFPYNPNLPPAESYAQLQNFCGWGYNSSESRESWDQYQNALREEFNMWFGSEEDLGSWHALCRAVRINPLPTTLRGCERVSSPG